MAALARFALRTLIVIALVLALAGLQWLRPLEGMNVFLPAGPLRQHPLAAAGSGAGIC